MDKKVILDKYVGQSHIELIEVKNDGYEVVETCSYGHAVVNVVKLYCDAIKIYNEYKV